MPGQFTKPPSSRPDSPNGTQRQRGHSDQNHCLHLKHHAD